MSLKPALTSFDLLGAVEDLLRYCGIDPRWVHGEATAAQVEATIREIGAPFADVPKAAQGDFIRAAVVGYLAGIVRTARATDEWRSQILCAIERGHEADTIDPELYQTLRETCTDPAESRPAPESAWPIH